MSALLDAALSYAARGWPVFPCTPGQKVPAGQLVHRGVLDATTDIGQIRAWWAAIPDANIGIATGSPGPDVVDIDVHDDGSGWDVLPLLAAERLIDGPGGTVETPSGGLHLYFAGTSQRNGSVRKAHVDFRGAGGYVLAPPSVFGGKPYTQAASYGTTPQAADWRAIRALLDPPPDPVPFSQPGRDKPADGSLRPGDDWAQHTSWPEILAPHGWRRIRDLGSGRAGWCRPGKEGRFISATTRDDGGLYVFSSSTCFETEVPYSKFGAYAVLEHGGDHAAAAAALRAAGYGTPLPAPAVTLTQPQQAAGGQQDDAEAPAEWWAEIAARHTPVDWQQLFDDTPDDEDWIIEPLLAAGRSIALYSPPKAGKSLIMLEICCALVTGRPVIGQPAGRPRKVLYVDLENSRRDLRDRLADLGYKPQDLAGLVYLSFPSMPALDSADGGREITALAIAHKADVVIIDTVSRVISGKENDADTFSALYRYAMAPLKGMGIAVARLDHAGKDIGKGQRGSSAKNADVDAVWTLSAAGPVVTLRCEMSRTVLPQMAIRLRRHASPLRHEAAVDAPDRITDVAARLDALELPEDITRRAAEDALRAAGERVSSTIVSEAIAVRKARNGGSEGREPGPGGSADLHGSPDASDDGQNSRSAWFGTISEPGEPREPRAGRSGSRRGPHVSGAPANQGRTGTGRCSACLSAGNHEPDCPERESRP